MLRTICSGAALTAVALTAAAATGASPAPEDPVVATVTDAGITMPSRVTGGVVAMRFRNDGTRLHEFVMGRADDGHSLAEARVALLRARHGHALPAWIRDVAGPGNLTAGAAITVTRRLRPGVYVVFDGVPDRGGVPGLARGLSHAFRVAGDNDAPPPPARAVITARAHGFEVPAIPAGTVTLELHSGATQPREFRLVTLRPGRTAADIGRWAAAFEASGRLPAGPAPATMLGAIQSIPAGATVYVTVRLQAGREYALGDDSSGALARFTPR